MLKSYKEKKTKCFKVKLAPVAKELFFAFGGVFCWEGNLLFRFSFLVLFALQFLVLF